MSKIIIEEHCKGTLEEINTFFVFVM